MLPVVGGLWVGDIVYELLSPVKVLLGKTYPDWEVCSGMKAMGL